MLASQSNRGVTALVKCETLTIDSVRSQFETTCKDPNEPFSLKSWGCGGSRLLPALDTQ